MQPTKADVGKLVNYYKNGWHYGHLQKLEKKKTVAVILPISTIKKKHCVHIPITDVELVEQKSEV